MEGTTDILNNLTVVDLKDVLRAIGLSTTGAKAELINRILSINPEVWKPAYEKIQQGKIESVSQTDAVREEVGITHGAQEGRNSACQSDPVQREIDLLRRENALLERELQFTRRELAASPNSVGRMSQQSHEPRISVRAISDLLSEFWGDGSSFVNWRRQVELLQTTYTLDDNSAKVMVTMRLKGKALNWFYSKSEHLSLTIDELLDAMESMFDHRPSKLFLRKEFEARAWQRNETFCDYYYNKVILANKATIDEEELVDYLIDGIPDTQLQSQARIQCFKSKTNLLEAFQKLSLRNDAKNQTERRQDQKGHRDVSSRKPFPTNFSGQRDPAAKYYNCNQEGHRIASCPKPRRERGSCFSCGAMGHILRDCPQTTKAVQQKPASTTTTALIDAPKESTSTVAATLEEAQIQHLKTPLTAPTRDCCVLLAEERDEHYYVEGLIDSGSAINVMTETTYLTYFNNYELLKLKGEFHYGGLNKSPLIVYGYIMVNIRFKLITNHVFMIKFVVVPDSTMTYSALLGREFINQPGVVVILKDSVIIQYNDPENTILNIEAITENDSLDRVRENLDSSLTYQAKDTLLTLLNNYKHAERGTDTVDYQFHIELTQNSKPFYFTPRRLSWCERNEVKQIINDLLSRRIIRHSNSSFSSPIVLVKKKIILTACVLTIEL